MLVLQFDGLYRNVKGQDYSNPQAGFMCFGWVITRHGKIIAQGHGGCALSRGASSNYAEYLALIEGLEALMDLGAGDQTVQVCGDAKSIIEQMRGVAGVSSNAIRPLHHRALRLCRRLPALQWVWTPRKNNRAADALTRRALRQLHLDSAAYQQALQEMSNPLPEKFNTRKPQRLLDLRIYQPQLIDRVLQS